MVANTPGKDLYLDTILGTEADMYMMALYPNSLLYTVTRKYDLKQMC